MQSKFKKGEKVLVIDEDSDCFNESGIVIEAISEDTYRVELEEEVDWFVEEQLRSKGQPKRAVQGFAKYKKPMSNLDRLSNLAKKVLSPSTKNMIKAGWLNEDLTLTEEGADVVISEYFSENEEKFGKLAAAALKERKDDKDC